MKDARRLVFRKDWTYSALDEDGKELWAGTFDLDTTAPPKVWDHRSHKSKKGDMLGIYELDVDTLKVCVVGRAGEDEKWMGKQRPKEFRLDGADALIEMRRVNPDR